MPFKRFAAFPAVLASVAVLFFFAVILTPSFSENESAAFGAYVGSATQPTALNSALGGTIKYATDFQTGTSWSTITQSKWPYPQWRDSGYSMIWGIPMLPDTYGPSRDLSNTSGSCYGLSQEAAGVFNAKFSKVAHALVSNGFGSSVVRLGWEFNSGWAPWSAGGCATQFVGAFQEIVTTMRAVSGADFTFEWNPTLGDQGDGDLANYYPGGRYVNYVGLDVYDTNWGRYPGAQAEFTSLKTQPYGLDWLAKFASRVGKRIVLPEWGLGWGSCNAGQPVEAPGSQVCGGDDPTFIANMASWIKANNVFEDTFWDYGTSSVEGCPDACTPIGRSAGDTTAIRTGNLKAFKALITHFGAGSDSAAASATTTTAGSTTTTQHGTTTTSTTEPPTTTTTGPPTNATGSTTTTTTAPPTTTTTTPPTTTTTAPPTTTTAPPTTTSTTTSPGGGG